MIVTWTETRDQSGNITSVEVHTMLGQKKKIDISKPVTVENNYTGSKLNSVNVIQDE